VEKAISALRPKYYDPPWFILGTDCFLKLELLVKKEEAKMNASTTTRHSVFQLTFRLISLASLLGLLSLPFATASADDTYRFGGGPDGYGSSQVPGWRFGPGRDSGGFEILHREHGRWHRVPGSGVQLAGDPGYPWLLNARNRIYRWNGHTWQRVSGRAVKIADGWLLGTDRRHGGFGIYRWNGYRFDRVSGGAVDIGGSYQRPWIVNDHGERYEWDGHGWRPLGRGFRDSLRGRPGNPFDNYRDGGPRFDYFDGRRDRDDRSDARRDDGQGRNDRNGRRYRQ
jgi:hypothetical protein